MKTKMIIKNLTCAMMVLSLTACGSNTTKTDEVTTDSSEMAVTENVQIVSPWTECADMKEAETNAGFTFEIPTSIDGYNLAYIQNMGTEIIEAHFDASDDPEKSINMRKGTGIEDLSGDYNIYSETNTIVAGAYNVTIQGDNGTVSLATWNDGNYSYALSTPEMSVEEVSAIIAEIK